MGWTDLVLRLRAFVRHRRAEGELDEELRFHMEMEARKQQAAGLSVEEARRSARVRFGGVEQVREECRDVRGVTLLQNLARDVRYGARLLRKTPGFTAIAILSLAIGIGANTAMFSLLDTVLLRMLPVRNPEQLVVVKWGWHGDLSLNATWATSSDDGNGGSAINVFTWAAFSEMRSRRGALTDVMGFSPLGPVNVSVGNRPIAAGAMVVSGNYFQALGVRTVVGRPITDDNDTADGLPSAVISYRFWERAFGLDPAAIGKTVYVNGQPCVVIGVAPRPFFGVSAGGFMRTPNVDLMLPIRSRERLEGSGLRRMEWYGNSLLWIQVMGRLNAGGESQARSEVAAIITANLPDKNRKELGSEVPQVFLDPGGQGLDTLRLAYQRPLTILMAVVGLTLLMACANLAGLLLARANSRQKEIMLRLAAGANRGRLVRQLVVEGAVLAAAGAVAGLGLAWCGVRALMALVATGGAPIPVDVTLNGRVLGFTMVISLATTFLFALVPALRATRVDLSGGLKEDTPAAGPHRMTGSRMLLAIQVAVALVLLAGATLFTRSLANLRSLPLGFNPHNVTLFDVAPGKNGYDAIRGNQFYSRLWERLRQMRGVTAVSLSTGRLLSGYLSNAGILVEGGSNEPVNSNTNYVGADFFRALGIPLILGRGIESRDLTATPRVAVINETLAHHAFGSGSPVGRRFRWSVKDGQEVEVIGVVKDAKYDHLRGDAPATIYVPYTQRPWGWPREMTFEVRSAGNAAEATVGIQRAVAEIDHMLPVTQLKTQEAQIDDSLAQEHLCAWLVSLFSAITLALACVGLYGSVAYTVTRRTRELGVRMALGANRTTVLRMLLGQVALTVCAGLAIGLPATWMLTRIIESQLYGIKPHDPASLAIACLGVIGVAMIAASIPARRALRIDPLRALRYE